MIGASSNLNIERVETIPNLVVVPLGNGGAATIYSQGGGHFIVDLSGVFVTASSSQDGRYVVVTPTRLMDPGPVPVASSARASPAPWRCSAGPVSPPPGSRPWC